MADAAVALDGTPIHALVDEFKQALLTADSDKVVVQRRIIEPAPAMMDPDAYFALREEVALGLGVHLKDVFMVGSGKMGFSIKPGDRRFQPFADTSDIDLVIKSHALFDAIWHEVVAWDLGGGEWAQAKPWRKYVSRGWIRPDFMPVDRSLGTLTVWRDFFRELSGSGRYGPYPINGGLYRDWFFLEAYQAKCVLDCRAYLKAEA